MKKFDKTTDSFFALLRAGLWEQSVKLMPFEPIEFERIYKIADEQSVIGLIAAGLEYVEDRKVTKPEAIPFLKKVFSLENRNTSMNLFIRESVVKMRNAGIYSILVKGQGIAQCYSRPLWRSAGDVDFFFNDDNYEKAKTFFIPLAESVDQEEKQKKHQAMTIDSWVVELHGLLPTGLSERINKGIEEIQNDIFINGNVRIWNNGSVDIFLPSPDNDVIIIFTHFLQHFFIGGVGLRQIADWCRLLWTYRAEINHDLLRRRLRKMGILAEWKAFAHFAVSYMGIPSDAIPFYESSSLMEHKSRRICRFLLKTGNMGHNIDQSYRTRYPKLIENAITFWRRFWEFCHLSLIFPRNGPLFFMTYVRKRARAVL